MSSENTKYRFTLIFFVHCFSSIENEDGESIPSTGTSDRRTKFNFEQLLNSSEQLKYLQNFKDSSLNFYKGRNDVNLSHTSRLEGYRNLVNSSEPLFELENNSEEYKNLHMKVLVKHYYT